MKVSAKRRDGKSVIGGLRQSGSYRMMFPRSFGTTLTGVAVNCAGGMTGGDDFALSARAQEGASLILTTQAAERIYRAKGDTTAQVKTDLQVAAGATLHWLPQETILFDRSRLSRRLDVDLAEDASFLMVEPVIFGRAAMGETVRTGMFHDQVRIRRARRLIHADASRLDGQIDAHLQGAAVTDGGRAQASIVFAGENAEAKLSAARALIGPDGGVSLKADGLLCARVVASDARLLRRSIIPLIALLSGADIPKTWTL